MKSLILLCIVFISFQGFSQNWTWNQKLEEAIYGTRIGRDVAMTTVVTKTDGFSHDDMYQIEYLCLEDAAEAVFKLEKLDPTTIQIYRLSAFDEYNLKQLLDAAIGANNYTIEISTSYIIPD